MAGSGLTYGYNQVDINDFNSVRYAFGSKLTEVPIVQQDGVQWKVNFKLLLQLEFGQSVCIVGSIPELGNWQEFRCFMKWTEGHVWTLQTPITSFVPYFQYKYVIMEGDQDLKWENGINRIADLDMLAESTLQTKEFLL